MIPWKFLTLFCFAIQVDVILPNPTHHDIHKRDFDYSCPPEPCRYGLSVCHDNTTMTYRCICNGTFCDKELIFGECASEPCQNGGSICHNTEANTYSCICSSGFTGSHCEYGTLYIDLDNTCASEPCRNGGSICPGETTNTYSCICSPGYIGNHCEIPAR